MFELFTKSLSMNNGEFEAVIEDKKSQQVVKNVRNCVKHDPTDVLDCNGDGKDHIRAD